MFDKSEFEKILAAHPQSGYVTAQWMTMDFAPGYESYSRSGLIITGKYGIAEATPLPGYFDDLEASIAGAIDTVTNPWPEPIRDAVQMNDLVSNDDDLEKLFDGQLTTIKIKLHSLADAERILRVRDIVGFDAKIRIDCNGKFTPDEAIELISRIKEEELEFVEQPCATIDECAEVRKRVDVPVALDESARSSDDIAEIIAKDAADLVVIKIQPVGGLNAAIKLINQWNKPVVISSMMESHVGIEVGTVLALSLPSLDYACGLEPSPIKNLSVEPLNQ